MGESTQELRRDIEGTREHLGSTLDTLGERVRPSRIVARRTDRVKAGFRSMKSSVMGTAGSVQSGISDGAHTVADQASSAAGAVVDEARQAPDQVMRQTRGTPLTAGVVAFGLGVVVAALLPATEPEQRAGTAVKDKLDDLKDEAKELGQELKETVQETAGEAASEVKDTARGAADEVKHEARSAATEVQDEAKSAAYEVKDEATGSNGGVG